MGSVEESLLSSSMNIVWRNPRSGEPSNSGLSGLVNFTKEGGRVVSESRCKSGCRLLGNPESNCDFGTMDDFTV